MAMNGGRVAILLATFNGARFLQEQLSSYANQTYRNWELVASDDGSQDQTIELLNQFRESVPQPVTILNGPGSGFWSNFQSLIHRARMADYFAFSDQDDIWLPNKLARAVSALENLKTDTPAIYMTRTRLIDEDGVTIGFSPLFKRRPSFRNALVQSIGGGNTMVLNRAARNLMKKAPVGLAIVSHDWWAYQFVTGANGIAIYDPDPNVLYRQHAHNIVGSNRRLTGRLQRLSAMMSGRFVVWNDINCKALDEVRYLLTAENRTAFDLFLRARKAPALLKPYYLARAGVHRQTVMETVGLYAASLLKRI